MQRDSININSKVCNYTVKWMNLNDDILKQAIDNSHAIVIDSKVYDLYADKMPIIKAKKNIFKIEVKEETKTPYLSLEICDFLLECGFKRNQTLLAIGGGTIQDLSTFAASIMFRGIKWIFVPTTLLAQADSCIGGKSSLNIGKWKNQIGNFYPPHEIFMISDFLQTLEDVEIRSGIGEIIKVHFLSGEKMAGKMVSAMDKIFKNKKILDDVIHGALMYKAKIIIEDEFDRGVRLKFNYGHSFGHAFEAGSDFALPHGLAVGVGMDCANYVALKQGRISNKAYEIMKIAILKNLRFEDRVKLDVSVFFDALKHDKKNIDNEYCFILPVSFGDVDKIFVPMNQEIDDIISEFIEANDFLSVKENQYQSYKNV